jgi:Putative MetA-pathway of phenol degradation
MTQPIIQHLPRLLTAAAALLLQLATVSAHGDAAQGETQWNIQPSAASGPGPDNASGGQSLSPICSDRPTKSDYACTVDFGHFQYETDLFNLSALKFDGTRSETWLATNPTVKYGLSPQMDLEANISPLEIVRLRDTSGQWHITEGMGDLYLRLKYQFLNIDNGGFQGATLWYLKAPTAHAGLGNGAVEGGVTLPLNFKVSDHFILTSAPEVDVYADAIGGGHHLNTAQTANLAICLPRDWVVYTELWTDWNFDPQGTNHQSSADIAVSYGATAYLQFDAGVNFGLSAATPGVQAYVGASQKL